MRRPAVKPDSVFTERRRKDSVHVGWRADREVITKRNGWAVDLDLDTFFDRVNHDAPWRVARRVLDKRVPRLPRRYLAVGLMADDVNAPSSTVLPPGNA